MSCLSGLGHVGFRHQKYHFDMVRVRRTSAYGANIYGLVPNNTLHHGRAGTRRRPRHNSLCLDPMQPILTIVPRPSSSLWIPRCSARTANYRRHPPPQSALPRQGAVTMPIHSTRACACKSIACRPIGMQDAARSLGLAINAKHV